MQSGKVVGKIRCKGGKVSKETAVLHQLGIQQDILVLSTELINVAQPQ